MSEKNAATRDRHAEPALWSLVESLDETTAAIRDTSWATMPVIVGNGNPRTLWHLLQTVCDQLDAEIGRRNRHAVS